MCPEKPPTSPKYIKKANIVLDITQGTYLTRSIANITMSLPPVYFNKDTDSFAFSTARVRWIKIIQDAIDDVSLTTSQSADADFKEQGAIIASQLKQLKDNVQNDGKVTPIKDTTLRAYQSYNEALEGHDYTWLTGPWLVLENYLYRIINQYFQTQSLWFNYDIFVNLKNDSFKSSEAGVAELAVRYFQLSEQIKGKTLDDEALSVLFREFAEISLWGNATDLSLLATATLDDIKSIQGAEARKKSEDKILTNDIDQAYKQLKSTDKKHKRVDFVLDNTGFELYTDLIFGLFLLDLKLADEIRLHTKDIPWMVSDVNIKDFYILLDLLKDTKTFPNHRRELDHLINKVEYLNNNGTLTLETSQYWTLDKDFFEISPSETKYGGAELFKALSESSLVVFKGDMNYRKLTGDRRWKPTNPFIESIGPLAKQGLKILSLRTVKADVIVGLEEGVYEKVTEEWGKTNENKLGWLSSGKYAVISYSNGDH